MGPAYFDDKQCRLINSWHNISQSASDKYIAYISEWIAFNAICYNLFSEKANIERANIDRSKSKLNAIINRFNPAAEIIADNAYVGGTSDKWAIEISLPERLYIEVKKSFTEDIIYSEYVKTYKNWYNQSPSVHFDNLKNALRKDNGSYVINMSRSHEISEDYSIEYLSKKNLIILCEKNDLITIKNVLYQIRCNIFHGEKIPGDINDDKIVIHALPLLNYLVSHLMKEHNIQ